MLNWKNKQELLNEKVSHKTVCRVCCYLLYSPGTKGAKERLLTLLTFVCVCVSMGSYTHTYIHSKQEYCLKKGNSITNYRHIPVHICWYFLFVIKIPPVSSEDFQDSSVVKESACNTGDPGLIPGSGRSAGEGICYQLQYSWASLVA